MDTARDPVADRIQALDTLRALAALLRREGEDDWLRSVRYVGGLLEPMHDVSPESVVEAMREAGRAWRDMNRGAGSFLDFYLAGTDRELSAFADSLRCVFDRYR